MCLYNILFSINYDVTLERCNLLNFSYQVKLLVTQKYYFISTIYQDKYIFTILFSFRVILVLDNSILYCEIPV